MTAQLASQRTELINANKQLDERRRFTETVIGGRVRRACSASTTRAASPCRTARPRT